MKPFELRSLGYLSNRDAYLIDAEFHDGMRIEALVPANGLDKFDDWEFDVYEDKKHKYTFEGEYRCGSDRPEQQQPPFGGLKHEELLDIFEEARHTYLVRIGA